MDWQSDVPTVNPHLAQVLDKAIKMELSSRYPTAEAMYQDLVSNHQSQPKTAPTLVIAPSASDSRSFTSTEIINSSVNSKNAKSNWISIAFGVSLVMASIIIVGGLWSTQKIQESANHQAEIKAMEAELEKKEAEYKQKQAEMKIAEAEKILEDNKKRQADLLKQEALNRELEAEKKRLEAERIASIANSQIQEPNQISNQPSPTQSSITSAIVYIHYSNNEFLAQELQDYLISQGVSIGDNAEQVNGIKRNDIRYSRPSSKKLALGVKNLVEQFYRERGIERNLSMIDLSTRGFNTSANNLEIWITD
jgi:serine/threonine-protein kinase